MIFKEKLSKTNNKFIYHYLKNTFEDELGKKDFEALLATHIVKQIIEPQIANKNSIWWDDISTKDKKENRATILTKSLEEAIVSLENQLGKDVNSWTWNKVHKLEHVHPIGQVKLLKPFFNVGKFDIAGSNEVINNLAFTYTDNQEHLVKAGPSTRRIIDFSDVENAVSILPTSISKPPTACASRS